MKKIQNLFEIYLKIYVKLRKYSANETYLFQKYRFFARFLSLLFGFAVMDGIKSIADLPDQEKNLRRKESFGKRYKSCQHHPIF